MSILCRIFGHSNVHGFSERSGMGGGDYATDVRGPYIDGIGRQHFELMASCPRCGESFLACKVHGNWISDRMECPKHLEREQ